MQRTLLKLLDIIKFSTMIFENIVQTLTMAITRDDIEKKIEKLHRERVKIVLRYSAIQRISILKKHGIVVENIEIIEDDSISEKDLKSIYDNLESIEYILLTEQKNIDLNKNKTVANLYLLNEKNKYFKAKIIAVLTMIFNAISIVFFSVPFWTIFIGLTLYLVFEAKDQVVSYRVSKGYFGTTTSEAIELIKFIRENIDKIDSGDGGGAKRKILNPIIKSDSDTELPRGELPNV